jgi:RNA polymerase sigma factor (TIGR02999 family)
VPQGRNAIHFVVPLAVPRCLALEWRIEVVGGGIVDDLSELISRVQAGEAGAQERLFAAAYNELRKLARSRLRDGGRNTFLDTTALVHESYLRFLSGGQLRADDRRAFFAYASRVMRSVIIDAVRERQAERRGGDPERLTLSTQLLDDLDGGSDDVLRVHEALDVLAQAEPRLAQVVEMRYFGGYTEAEVAEALGVTDRTVSRDWEKARLLLSSMLKD